jgi:hypothetical protein
MGRNSLRRQSPMIPILWFPGLRRQENLFVGVYSDKNGHPERASERRQIQQIPKSCVEHHSSTCRQRCCGQQVRVCTTRDWRNCKFRQKSATGGWVDELNAVRTLTSLPPHGPPGQSTRRAPGHRYMVRESPAQRRWQLPYCRGVRQASDWTAKVGTS